MIISTLLDPEGHPHWQGILRLLETSSTRFGQRPWDVEHLVWVVIEDRQIIAAFTTRLLESGEAEIVNVAGHRAAEWLGLADERTTAWATMAGATKMITRGRKGWVRLNAALGWKRVGQDGIATVYEKAL